MPALGTTDDAGSVRGKPAQVVGAARAGGDRVLGVGVVELIGYAVFAVCVGLVFVSASVVISSLLKLITFLGF